MTDALKAGERAEQGRVNAVAQVLDAIAPLARASTFEDHVGQHLAALRFEIAALDALQVEDMNEAAELVDGLHDALGALNELWYRWSRVVAGGVG